MTAQSNSTIIWFEAIGRDDLALVGGKNASLGELVTALTSEGIRVPPGFATTAEAYWTFLKVNGFEERMRRLLSDLDEGKLSLEEAGKAIRELLLHGDWPEPMTNEITAAYRQLCERAGKHEVDVAVRSSATAEDLPGASFAGQQETFLNIRGEKALLAACRRCYASLFTDRAISYRNVQGFDHMSVALSIGVQQMVRADSGGSGVMFSIDTETGFKDVVLIDAAWGLGENVVQGVVDPDEYQVFKPLLADPGLVPIIGKKRGGKEKKLIYAAGEKPTRNLPTSKAERIAFVLEDQEILSSPDGPSRSKPIMAARWISNGPRTVERARFSSSRRGRNGACRAVGGPPSSHTGSSRRAETPERPRHRGRDRGGPRLPDRRFRRYRRFRRWFDPGHPHH